MEKIANKKSIQHENYMRTQKAFQWTIKCEKRDLENNNNEINKQEIIGRDIRSIRLNYYNIMYIIWISHFFYFILILFFFHSALWVQKYCNFKASNTKNWLWWFHSLQLPILARQRKKMFFSSIIREHMNSHRKNARIMIQKKIYSKT